jgi:ribosomal protein S18 acetylase RimI-like enzyme
LLIRSVDRSDVPLLLPLMEDFNRWEAIEWNQPRTEAAIDRLLDDPALGFMLVALTDRIVGYAVVTYNFDLEFGGRDAIVTEVFVVPEVRRNGIGRKLMQVITERAMQEKLTSLHLAVRPENERARQLYTSEGYRLVPRLWMTKLL